MGLTPGGSASRELTATGAERGQVDEFMAPFGQVGTVEVLLASRCEAVIARAAC